MKGFFLQGGGAKGAFQAGAIKALYELGIEPDIISGTSIGAVNSYFLMTGNIKKMEEFWINIDKFEFDILNKDDVVVENMSIINKLRELDIKESKIKKVYINYVSVEKSQLIERSVEIKNMNKEEQLEYIRYSALYPFISDISINTSEIEEKFKVKVENGDYDGYKLDGGLVNNKFTEPLEKGKIDELYLITMYKKYRLSDNLINTFSNKKIILIKPEFMFKSTDTFNFNGDFCRELFKKGYKTTKRTI